MNRLLLEKDELNARDEIRLDGRRAEHIAEVLRADIGDRIKIGIVDGAVGSARIIDIQQGKSSPQIQLQLDQRSLQENKTTALDITLIIALPRPKVATRLIRLCAECGIKQLHFINSYRVEKSYWQSPRLSAEKIHRQLLLGLEQCGDTALPQVHLQPRFKPFVEDSLPAIIGSAAAWLAHPYDSQQHFFSSACDTTPKTLVVGPEGGFIPYEVEQLQRAGCIATGLGARIYRVETVVPLMLGRLLRDNHPAEG